MADELTISVAARFDKGGVIVEKSFVGLKFDVSGDDVTHKTQSIGTSEEALVMGDVTTPGYMLVINHDGTNYVEIRPATGVADMLRLNAGEVALFRLAADATAPYAIANTSACIIEYWLFEA